LPKVVPTRRYCEDHGPVVFRQRTLAAMVSVFPGAAGGLEGFAMGTTGFFSGYVLFDGNSNLFPRRLSAQRASRATPSDAHCNWLGSGFVEAFSEGVGTGRADSRYREALHRVFFSCRVGRVLERPDSFQHEHRCEALASCISLHVRSHLKADCGLDGPVATAGE